MKKFPKITYTWTQPFPMTTQWNSGRLSNAETMDIILMAYDLMEHNVEESQNIQAIRMLESIGIKC